jgi:glycine dehydrogenase subunit 1
MCVTEKLMRKMPGRIVGATQDNRGNRAFVLTLQAREQHIRRQKATSNICSNQSLMALWVTIYLSIMGKEGLKQAAQMSFDGAHYLQQQLLATGRFTATHTQPFFNEFCLDFNGDADKLQQHLTDNGIMGGVKMGDNTIMFAVTEKRTKEEMDQLVSLIKNF